MKIKMNKFICGGVMRVFCMFEFIMLLPVGVVELKSYVYFSLAHSKAIWCNGKCSVHCVQCGWIRQNNILYRIEVALGFMCKCMLQFWYNVQIQTRITARKKMYKVNSSSQFEFLWVKCEVTFRSNTYIDPLRIHKDFIKVNANYKIKIVFEI